MRLLITLFTASLLLFACQQQNPQPNQPNTQSGSSFFIQASINGTGWSATELENGCEQYMSWTTDIDYLNDILKINYLSGFDQSTWISPITQVLDGDLRVGFAGFVHNYTDYNNDPVVFHSSLTGVSSAYYEDSSTIAGPEISYLDSNGDAWSTRYGDQSSSSFLITSNTQFNNGVGIPERHIAGNFTCTLYKVSDPTQTKSVGNGSFRLRFQKDD